MLKSILRIICYIPYRILFPTIVVNRKNLIKKGRTIYAVNHQSLLDAPTCCVVFARNQFFMAKKEIFKGKFSNWFYRMLGAFPVDRGNIDMQAMRKCKAIMESEQVLTIFPQGTRVKNADDFESMKNGAVYVALKYHAPIQPMFFTRKVKLFRFNKLIVGKPISFEEYYNEKPTKELLSKLSDKLISEMNNLQNEYVQTKKIKNT